VIEPLRVTAFGKTDVGLIRDVNQDAFVLGDLEVEQPLAADLVCDCTSARGPLLIVCDGMGGMAGGDVASKLAIESVWQEMQGAQLTSERPVFARLLKRAIRAANGRLAREVARKPELHGMGTTVSAAGLAGGALILAQVGDSRAYIERGGSLTQVTRDQSVVSALVHAGRLSASEARLSDQRSLILQALGTADDVEVSLSIVELRRGDRLLLCSDGLHGPVGDEAMRWALGEHSDLQEAAEALVQLAYQGGAPDNITVLLARFEGELLPPPGPADHVRFTELDPNEEGDRALTDTSWVARRLAARAGLRSGGFARGIPATGQHAIVRGPPASGSQVESRDGEDSATPGGPATRALAQGSRLGLVAWASIVAVAVAILVYVFWDLL